MAHLRGMGNQQAADSVFVARTGGDGVGGGDSIMNIRKGDKVLLFNGEWVEAAGTPFRVSIDEPHYYCFPAIVDEYQIPVGVNGVIEVWRNDKQVPTQLELFK